MTVCNVCKKELVRVKPHEFLCFEHRDAVPPLLMDRYIEAAEHVARDRKRAWAERVPYTPIRKVRPHLVDRLALTYAACRTALGLPT